MAKLLPTELKKKIKLEDVHVLVMSESWPGTWGKGKTLNKALENAEKPRYYRAYFCHADTTVDGMGSKCFLEGFQPVEFYSVLPKEAKKSPKKKE